MAGLEGVQVNHIIGSHWDPRENTEVKSVTQSMLLNSTDARELAANLLKAADHADEVERNNPKNSIRGRY